VTAGVAERTRYARVQAAMARHGVGALLIATPHLATFASGARRVQVAGSGGTVPWVVVLAGAPSAVVFTTDPDGVPPWMPRAAVEPLRWDRGAQHARIAALVAEVDGTVACDFFAPALRAALAGRTLVDATPLLAEAVAPRAAVEVEAVARALVVARGALDASARAVTPGVATAELAARAAEHSAGFPLAETMVRRAGDLVQLEVSLYVAGHAGVAGDTVGCDVDVSDRRRAWAEALCAVASGARDGASTGALRAAARAAGAGATGLLAHGLGVGIEPPLVDLDADDDAPLRAGTILVVAPDVGGFRATRALVVTERAPRWIEPAP
jgi:Xaa-Pro aminopeptidase